MRKCIATQERFPKKELMRIVRTVDGTVQVDTTGKLNGRGAYLKLSKEAIEMAKKTNVLKHALETEVDSSIYEELLSLVKE